MLNGEESVRSISASDRSTARFVNCATGTSSPEISVSSLRASGISPPQIAGARPDFILGGIADGEGRICLYDDLGKIYLFEKTFDTLFGSIYRYNLCFPIWAGMEIFWMNLQRISWTEMRLI